MVQSIYCEKWFPISGGTACLSRKSHVQRLQTDDAMFSHKNKINVSCNICSFYFISARLHVCDEINVKNAKRSIYFVLFLFPVRCADGLRHYRHNDHEFSVYSPGAATLFDVVVAGSRRTNCSNHVKSRQVAFNEQRWHPHL